MLKVILAFGLSEAKAEWDLTVTFSISKKMEFSDVLYIYIPNIPSFRRINTDFLFAILYCVQLVDLPFDKKDKSVILPQ